MKQDMRNVFWCTLALAVSVSLSGCSVLPDALTHSVSSFNPFQQTAAPLPTPYEAAPTKEVAPAPAPSIRVQVKPPAPPKGAAGLEVNVGNNKQCTTFCAIPMRKPAAK
ncbi:MAG: hypothetical protein BWK73_43490 [Thiothrix lacustris]|uniref:Lipoprotein n=1 Tax=Thiothrix lacustris TaxID=525917 RepID=A0A1Y1QBY9_9GAMM|nr:MAG: hypothetical protein BWK73_43490 [Thiothrix lacustris]